MENNPRRFNEDPEFNQSSQREQKKLTLRKNKMDAQNRKERMEAYSKAANIRMYSAEDDYEINLNTLQISPQIIESLNSKQTIQDKVKFLSDYFQSANLFEKKFAVKTLERMLNSLKTTDFPQHKEAFDFIFLGKVMYLLTDANQERQIVYESSKIICYLVYFDNGYISEIIKNSPNIFQKATQENDKIIQKQLLWILCNIMVVSAENYTAVVQLCPNLPAFVIQTVHSINDKFNEIYSIIDILPSIFWLYSMLLKFSPDKYLYLESQAYIDIPVLAKFLKAKVHLDLFEKTVQIFYVFSEIYNDAYFDTNNPQLSKINFDALEKMVAGCEISKSLLEFFSEWDSADAWSGLTQWSRNNALAIFANLAFLKGEVEAMMDDNVLMTNLEICIQQYRKRYDNDQYFENVLTLLHILIDEVEPRYYEKIVKKHSIFKNLIDMYFSNRFQKASIRKRLIEVFNSILTCQAKNYCIGNLLIIRTPEFLFDFVRNYRTNHIECIIQVFECIISLIDTCDTFRSSGGINTMIDLAKKNDVIEILERIACEGEPHYSPISEYADNILKKYFKPQ